MFKVVQDQQDSLLAQDRYNALLQRPIARVPDTEGTCHGGYDQLGVRHWHEIDVAHAVLEQRCNDFRRRLRKASFARSRRSNEGEQTNFAGAQRIGDLRNLPVSRDDRCREAWQPS
jgi:hypothetical protein